MKFSYFSTFLAKPSQTRGPSGVYKIDATAKKRKKKHEK
jgi:hypothetical protein